MESHNSYRQPGTFTCAASFHPYHNDDSQMFREELEGSARLPNNKGITQLVCSREEKEPNFPDSECRAFSAASQMPCALGEPRNWVSMMY